MNYLYLYPAIACLAAMVCGPVLGFCGSRAFFNWTRGKTPEQRTFYAPAEILSALFGFLGPFIATLGYWTGYDEGIWPGIVSPLLGAVLGASALSLGISFVWMLEWFGKVLGRMVDRLTLHQAKGQ